MPAILVIGGLIVLFVIVRSGNGVAGATGSASGRTGSGGSMPDPGAAWNAGMVGSAAHPLPPVNAITPFPGTAKLAPDQALALLNGSNRIAAFGVGTPGIPLRAVPPPTLKTSNPATTPFSAVASNPINATQAFGPGRNSATTVKTWSGRKL